MNNHPKLKMKSGRMFSLVGVLMFLVSFAAFSQEKEEKIDSSYANYYYKGRMELFNTLSIPRHAIVFLGNSITERGAWGELLPGKKVVNRGIGGDNTFGLRARMDEVIAAKPKKIFLLIGINDLSRGLPIPIILRNYRTIVDRIRNESPHTKLYIESVMPLNEAITKPDYLKNKKVSILNLNKGIKEIADQYNVPYINLHEIFADEKGDLKAALTADGIHPRPAAYVIWIDYLKKKKYL